MKKNIHPELHDVVAHCACGNEFKTRTTETEIKVTLCSSCHPFFTGAHKFVDTAGRIEKFNKRYAKESTNQVKKATDTLEAKKAAKKTAKK